MKAITLTQPWATLVAIGAKQIETRSWWTSYRGPLAIHAAKGFPCDTRALCVARPFREALELGGVLFRSAPREHQYHVPEPYRMVSDLPLGAIVAIVRLDDVVETRALAPISDQEDAFGDFTHGRFAWLLADIKRLPSPIPCKGALRLWTVPREVAVLLERSTP